MWFLSDSLSPAPEDVLERGIYAFLLGDEPAQISTNAPVSEASFFDLSLPQRKQTCHYLCKRLTN